MRSVAEDIQYKTNRGHALHEGVSDVIDCITVSQDQTAISKQFRESLCSVRLCSFWWPSCSWSSPLPLPSLPYITASMNLHPWTRAWKPCWKSRWAAWLVWSWCVFFFALRLCTFCSCLLPRSLAWEHQAKACIQPRTTSWWWNNPFGWRISDPFNATLLVSWNYSRHCRVTTVEFAESLNVCRYAGTYYTVSV